MAGSASVRYGFRWANDDFSEPSSVLALSVGGFYVDLRTVLKDGSIEWAMAGKREILQQEPLKVRWTRYIDSFGEAGAVDDGDFKTLENGDELESGTMASPDHGGKPTYYEEIWRDGALVKSLPGSWIAESVDKAGSERGQTWLGRVGGYYLAMQQMDSKGEEFVALRQDWNEEQKAWNEKYAYGKGAKLPSVSDVESERFNKLEEGTEFDVGGRSYVLRSKSTQ